MKSERIGIIVGRFQVPELHNGHKKLISESLRDFDRVFIFIGHTISEKLTKHDPFPKEVVRDSILKEFPELENNIYYICDIGNYPLWVKNLDDKIDRLIEYKIIGKNSSISICGSRDSVADKYKENGGKYNIHIIVPEGLISGTLIREQTADNYKPVWSSDNKNFLIWLLANNKI